MTMDHTQRRSFHGCMTCRKRKVRCKGGNPCQNCVKLKAACVSSFDSNLRMSLGDPRSSQKRDLPSTPRQEPSPPSVKLDASGEPKSSQQRHSPPEPGQSVPSATLNYMDLDSKWPTGSDSHSGNPLPQPILHSVNYGLGFDSGQPSDSDLVGLDGFHISTLSDFDFSFDPIFNRDIEFPSWSDAALTVDILDPSAITHGSETLTLSANDLTSHSNKRRRRSSTPIDAAGAPSPNMNQDVAYLAHFERWINRCGYSSREDGKGNYLRYVLDYVRSEHCSNESPFRYAVLAWTAKHLAKVSVSYDKTWKSYYVRATKCLEDIACCGDSHKASETRSTPSSGQSALSSQAEIKIASLLFLCRCDVLNGDATSILRRLDNFKEHLRCHLDDGPLSALACKFLLWLCYIDVRLRIFSTLAPPNYDGRNTPITTLLDALIHHPSYNHILSHSHSYVSETFGETYPPEELVQDAKKMPVSVRTHETFCLISNMLQYRSWKYLAEQKADLPVHRELAEAKEAAINLDIRRMDTEFDLAKATNPAANSLCGVITSAGHNSIESNPATHTANGIAKYDSFPLTASSSTTSLGAPSNDRASLQWLSCYAAFLAAKVLWSRFLYPTIRSDSTATIATSGILKIALRLREIHRKSRLASSIKIPRSMLWPLPVFIAGIETTDEIYADWISEFIDEMDSTMNNTLMNNAAKNRGGNNGVETSDSTEDKTDDLKLILMLMKRVREKQDLSGCRVDVQKIMSEIKGADDIFLL